MALPPNFLDELRLRTPLPALIGRKTKVTRAGRQWRACCPFHGEKTPSFYIYDDHFHCFGCGAHGDAIAFVMQGEGASFPEAVERLAGEAGLEVPKATPRQAKREAAPATCMPCSSRRRGRLRRRLRLPEGRRGLAYLPQPRPDRRDHREIRPRLVRRRARRPGGRAEARRASSSPSSSRPA
jgi:DNA primase